VTTPSNLQFDNIRRIDNNGALVVNGNFTSIGKNADLRDSK